MLASLALGSFERAAPSTKVEVRHKVGVLITEPITSADAIEEGVPGARRTTSPPQTRSAYHNA